MRLRGLTALIFISTLAVTGARAADCRLQSETFESALTLAPKSFRVELSACRLGGVAVTSLRSFTLSRQPYSLVVDTERVITGIVPSVCLQTCTPLDTDEQWSMESSRYQTALIKAAAAPQPLQDGGVKHASSDQIQMFVTADLCPSEKPLVREVFERMMSLAKSSEPGARAVPVALSVSGEWMQRHADDLAYLKDQERFGNLQITWVNHTLTHPYDPALPLAHNFVLETGVNFTREILDNEKLMLKNGLVPSVFVRLPGLISDQAHMTQLREWGLIPLGADAWLAKGQNPHNGSIILIHANGNEPKGIRIFENLLGTHGWWIKIFNSVDHLFDGTTMKKDDHG